MNRRMKIASALTATALAVAIGSTAAYAAIPDSNTGIISGCYSTLTGAVKVIDAQHGQSCGLLEKPLSWNSGSGDVLVTYAVQPDTIPLPVPNNSTLPYNVYLECPVGSFPVSGYVETQGGYSNIVLPGDFAYNGYGFAFYQGAPASYGPGESVNLEVTCAAPAPGPQGTYTLLDAQQTTN